MNLDKKISQAKSKLLVEYPYFGDLASKLELKINDDIEAFKSDGKTLYYREDYLKELEIDEIEFILANGAMHKALSYQNRQNKRSGWLWQMATDISINSMLLQNGLKLPYGAQYRKRFDGMYAEEIYEELKDDILRDEEDAPQPDEEYQNSNDEEDILQEQLFSQDAINKLEEAHLNQEVPEAIDRFFTLDYQSKVDWRDELRVALERYFKNDYTLLPPSKKLISYGIYLPSSISNTFKLIIAIDSSGSIDDTLLSQFLSEVEFLMSLIQNYQIDILVCDDKIRSHKTFYSAERLALDIVGGGATDFRPVFEYIEKNHLDTQLLLYFSDLEGIFPDNEPLYEVKWISPKDAFAPFGDIIKID